jgi:hypothetical protein
MKKVIIIFGLLFSFIYVNSQKLNLDYNSYKSFREYEEKYLKYSKLLYDSYSATSYFNQPKFDNIDTLFLYHIKVYEESLKNTMNEYRFGVIDSDSFIFWEIFYRFLRNDYSGCIGHGYAGTYLILNETTLDILKEWYLNNRDCLNLEKIKCLIKTRYYYSECYRLLNEDKKYQCKICEYVYDLREDCLKQNTFIENCIPAVIISP